MNVDASAIVSATLDGGASSFQIVDPVSFVLGLIVLAVALAGLVKFGLGDYGR